MAEFAIIQPAQLKGVIVEALKEALSAESKTEVKPIGYLTRKEVANLLHISLPTLTDYVKDGLLPAYTIGKRVLFKRSEIEASLEEVKSVKHKMRR